MPAATTVWRTAAAVGVVPMLAQPAWEGSGLSQQGRGGLNQLQAVLLMTAAAVISACQQSIVGASANMLSFGRLQNAEGFAAALA